MTGSLRPAQGKALPLALRTFGIPLLACTLATLAAIALRGVVLQVNFVLLYLLLVLVVTVFVGKNAGVFASLLSVLAYDVFLVPPYHSIAVHDVQHVLTFVLMLIVALVASHLSEGLGHQRALAQARERQANLLREMSVALAGAADLDAVTEAGALHASRMFDDRVMVLVPAADGGLVVAASCPAKLPVTYTMLRIANTIMTRPPRASDACLSSAGMYYFGLDAPGATRGVLIVAPHKTSGTLPTDREAALHTAAAQLALALERVHLADLAAAGAIAVKVERFRNAVLSAISHDLRTPITAIAGLASHLMTGGDSHHKELAGSIHDVAVRMNSVISNLLDHARFSQNGVHLARDWHMVDEVIGSAIAIQSAALARLEISVVMRGEQQLLELDAALIERTLCNLLDNVVRHARGASAIRIQARFRSHHLALIVDDNGCGLAPHRLGAAVPPVPVQTDRGGGLGLSLCQTIVEAHAGKIRVRNRHDGGARALILLPLSTPPER
jgi:K+-sensing histidine kinase KdpD